MAFSLKAARALGPDVGSSPPSDGAPAGSPAAVSPSQHFDFDKLEAAEISQQTIAQEQAQITIRERIDAIEQKLAEMRTQHFRLGTPPPQFTRGYHEGQGQVQYR